MRYVFAAKLVNELVASADERQLSRTIARYGRVEPICLNELGYMELDRRGAELLFQVLTEREERTASPTPAPNDSQMGPSSSRHPGVKVRLTRPPGRPSTSTGGWRSR